MGFHSRNANRFGIKRVSAAFAGLLLARTALGADIPVISGAADGSETMRMLPQSAYSRVVADAVGAVHESVLPQLQCAPDSGAWRLHTVIVGVGIAAQVGLGPIFSITAKPRIRLLYTRADAPVFPLD